MKLGIVGSGYMIGVIHKMVDFEGMFIEAVDYACHSREVAALLKEIQKDLDAILFTGNFFFDYACRVSFPGIPWGYAKRNSSAVLRCLLHAVSRGENVSKITFDLANTRASQMNDLLCKDLQVKEDDVAVYRYNDTMAYMDYLAQLNSTEEADEREELDDYIAAVTAWHMENLESGRATLCLSGSIRAAQAICEAGYPAYYVQPVEEELVAAINELRIRYEIQKEQREEKYQIAVLDLYVRMEESFSRGLRDYRQLNSSQQVESTVHIFAQSVGGAVEKRDGDHYVIYATKAEVDAVTGNMSRMQFLERLGDINYVKQIALGIGASAEPGTAKNRAQHSSSVAGKQKFSCYYIMDDKTNLPEGPFAIELGRQEKDPEDILIERVARETSVGIVVLNMLARAQAQYGFREVTPVELASMCGMTPSNMNRILAKLEEGGYAQVVGMQHHSEGGRPSRLFRLNFGKES